MGGCCPCGRGKPSEIHPLTNTHQITYQSVGNSQYPTLLVDVNKAYDKKEGEDSKDSEDELFDEIELNLSVRNLPKQRFVSCPCDPFIIVSIKDEIKNVYNVVGQTEIVDDNPNADFSKYIRIQYMFESVQYVRLDIYDANDDDNDDDGGTEKITVEELSKHHFVGAAEFIVGDLVTANGQKLVMAIEDKNGNKLAQNKLGQPLVIVRSQEVTNDLDEVALELSARDLPKLKFCGGIDPFFQVYRKTNGNDDEWVSVYTSKIMKSTRSPNWESFTVQKRRLCDGDVEKPILIKIWDFNRDALPVFACELKTNLAALLDSKSIPLKNNTKNSGQLIIRRAKVLKKYPFVSYLSGGLECHFMTAIDFTGSNGNPNDEKSLHYMGPPYYESQYMKVIKSVGRVLAPYDVDGNIHAYGFGANLTPQSSRKSISHCFPLTYPSTNAQVDGIEGLIDAYKNCLNRVQLYGPTYMSEIIRTCAAKSRGICTQNNQSYNILLLITDGRVNDLRKTMDAIVEASGLALSIVLVGVGDANFDNMESLDADDDPLRHSQTGKVMEKCIVTFVPFNEFKDQRISVIAKETLKEIPEQVSAFMMANNIHPNPPRMINNDEQKTDNYYSMASAPILE